MLPILFGVAGAIALHQKLDMKSHSLYVVWGEGRAQALEGKYDSRKGKSQEKNEAEKAAKALNAHDIIFFDLGDYPLEIDKAAKIKIVDLIRRIQPNFMMSHSKYDQYTDHMLMTKIAIETRMIVQAWGHNPGEQVLAPHHICLNFIKRSKWDENLMYF